MKLRGPADAYHASDAPEAGFLQQEARAVLMGLLDDVGPDARTALLLSSEGFSGADRGIHRAQRARDAGAADAYPDQAP